MIDYYSYFDLKRDSSILEVVDKLALFLMRVRSEVIALSDDGEKEGMTNAALRIVHEVSHIFSTPFERERYDEVMREQMIISSKLFKSKKQVFPMDELQIQTKRTWLRILSCLIPHLESEKHMSFLKDDNYNEILDFMLDHTSRCYFDDNRTSYFIALDIVKRSFGIAASKTRNNVQVEDVVTAINQSSSLSDEVRKKLAVLVFDKWYRSEIPEEKGLSYQKVGRQ